MACGRQGCRAVEVVVIGGSFSSFGYIQIPYLTKACTEDFNVRLTLMSTIMVASDIYSHVTPLFHNNRDGTERSSRDVHGRHHNRTLHKARTENMPKLQHSRLTKLLQ